MDSGYTAMARGARARGPAVALAQVVALAGAATVFVLTERWNSWRLWPLLAIAVYAIVSDLTAVETGSSKLKVSGGALGIVLAAVLLGGGPAALVGMLAAAVGWFRWREAPHYLRNNLVTFTCFPLASGVFFHGVVRVAHIGSHDVTYYLLVLPAFVVALVLNFVGVAGYQTYMDGESLAHKAREALIPLLSAQLFSAVLTVAAVYFVVSTGTVGIALLLVMLAIFQYLVGELLTSQQRATELQRKATTDELTGLANRERFSAAVEEEILAARAGGAAFAVMLIDLDRFKEINDTLGHHYGDVLLRDLGPRLAASVGPAGMVARLGGDEFAVLPGPHTDDPSALAAIAAGLLACVQEPVVVDELTLEVGASIGISRFPLDGDDVHALLRRADVAMYSAKEDHSSYKLYAAKLDRYSVRRLSVLSDFRRALESDEFVVHYQPIVELNGRQVRGAEGLVRWQHPELGLLLPGDFIPIAEQSGLIGPLTRHVLERAIAECTAWRAAGHDLAVAVNLSVRDLLDRDLPAQVSSVLAAHRLPPEALHLEITESMILSDPDRALATVTRLRELGVCISVDDFGTGYSSLSNLKRLPITELKIDRSFVSSLSHDEGDLTIVRFTVDLGHDLGLKVIAEGVEDELTLKRLSLLGCDLAQGNHVSHALPSEEFAVWLSRAAGPAANALSA
jgi:diguanylate cyclase (GGDEF)-like protein